MKKTVTIYSTPTCHFCHMAKDYFSAHGITYTDYNVFEDAERRTELVEKSGQMGVPVISIIDPSVPEGQTGHEEIVIGFDEGHLAHALGITG